MPISTNIARKAHDAWNFGACNPRGIARGIVEALDEVGGEPREGESYAAVRVMLAQLTSLLAYASDGIGGYTVAGTDQLDADLDMLRAIGAAASKEVA